MVQSVVILRNQGRAAGASQEHQHSQILAFAKTPSRLADELTSTIRHFRTRGLCLTCQTIELEMEDNARVVCANDAFVAVTAFAPRFPYETWILPRSHAHNFGESESGAIPLLASILRRVLSAMEGIHADCPYNLVLQTAPVKEFLESRQSFHWRLEILPRLTTPSGLELGSDVFIVGISPELAAERLRAGLA
jgi:UDPglucose--hexose-1-phosphate uridylyltransferase